VLSGIGYCVARGGELYELLTSGKNQGFVFREDRASRLMKDMISSVKYLHSLGIVHRLGNLDIAWPSQ
jgi:serine/threonine protein kinase